MGLEQLRRRAEWGRLVGCLPSGGQLGRSPGGAALLAGAQVVGVLPFPLPYGGPALAGAHALALPDNGFVVGVMA